MTEISKLSAVTFVTVCVLLASLPLPEANGHGGGNWDPFSIDQVNDKARTRILKVQQDVSDLIRERTVADTWPMPELKRLQDDLITMKEETDEVLEHYVTDDNINLQVPRMLQNEPRAGRTLAASQALQAGIALLAHAATLEDQSAFIGDFYAQGMSARLFELLDAHRDRMDLYAVLTDGGSGHAATGTGASP